MNCSWKIDEVHDDGSYVVQCERCPNRFALPATTKPETVRAICKGVNPSPVRKLWNFTLASIRYFYSGAGTRTDEEIEQIIEVCKGCELFNGKSCTSKKCGCLISPRKFFSKVAWQSESCPEDKW